jgi:hypothetical protein
VRARYGEKEKRERERERESERGTDTEGEVWSEREVGFTESKYCRGGFWYLEKKQIRLNRPAV